MINYCCLWSTWSTLHLVRSQLKHSLKENAFLSNIYGQKMLRSTWKYFHVMEFGSQWRKFGHSCNKYRLHTLSLSPLVAHALIRQVCCLIQIFKFKMLNSSVVDTVAPWVWSGRGNFCVVSCGISPGTAVYSQSLKHACLAWMETNCLLVQGKCEQCV